MNHPRSLAVFLCLACFWGVSSFGQTVAPIGDPAREMKRTAHQLHISVERLRNAREVLNEATVLARHSSDSQTFSQLAQDWVRINRVGAPAALEDLYGWLRTTARDAQDGQTYQRCLSAAQSMLRMLATEDSDKAVSLWRLWPDPPTALGPELAKMREQVAAQFEKQLAGGTSGPGTQIDLTSLREQVAKGDYNSAGILAMQLNQYGNHTEALKAVDQALASFQQGSQDPRVISSYFGFVRQLSGVDSDRYLQGLNALMPSLNNQAIPGTGGTLAIGNQTLQLTAAEAAVVDLCRSLNGRPDLAMKTLGTVPGLKAKLDGIGGIDAFVSTYGPTSYSSKSQVSFSYSIDGVRKTVFNSSNGSSSTSTLPINATAPPPVSPFQSSTLLYQSLRGKLAKDPAFVKQKLAEAASTPDQIDVLINLVNYASFNDGDLAALALDMASGMVMRVEPLSKRASVIENLIQAYQRSEGEVDAGLMQVAMSVVQQLREEQSNTPIPPPGARGPVSSRGTMADQLETAIIAELALDNFDGAMKYLRLMSDEQRLQALLHIIQTLLQPF